MTGQTGELLSHNMFAYCKNNPVKMEDSTGFRYDFSGIGHDTGDDAAVAFVIMNNRYDYSSGTIIKKFNYKQGTAKGTSSGIVDKIGEAGSAVLIKGKKVYEELGTWTLGGYVNKFTGSAKFGKKALGIIGTVGFAGLDIGWDIYNHEYFSAGVDGLSALAGFGAGLLIGAGAAALITASTPILLIGAIGVGAFALTVGTGVMIDKVATRGKDLYYGR